MLVSVSFSGFASKIIYCWYQFVFQVLYLKCYTAGYSLFSGSHPKFYTAFSSLFSGSKLKLNVAGFSLFFRFHILNSILLVSVTFLRFASKIIYCWYQLDSQVLHLKLNIACFTLFFNLQLNTAGCSWLFRFASEIKYS